MATTPHPPTTEEYRNVASVMQPEDADLHLQRMLAPPEVPWYRGFFQNIKEVVRPTPLPPLEVTSKPVAVKDIWGGSGGNEKTAGLSSMLVHGGVIGLLLLLGTNETIQKEVKDAVTLIAPDLAPYQPKAAPQKQTMGGGGGGGNLAPTPASKGKLPKVAKQFVPPTAVIMNEQPKLVMEPSIEVQPNAPLPQVALNTLGDPFGLGKLPSSGPGARGGIGSGAGGGVGSGRGTGVGPGTGGGIGGGAYRIGGGVSAPTLLTKIEPEYSEEARKAKFQGTVMLYVEVDEAGRPRNIRVVRPLGLGLDEKAVEAVTRWRFRPGFKDGKAVTVAATVEVNFRLL